MGTSKCKNRNQLVKDLWLWCMEHNVWLTAVHIPGAENIDADQQSRVLNTSTEWTLNKSIFATAISKLGVCPNIELFASRLNFQIQPYVSFNPDPGAIAINVFHMSWKPYLSYVFPPFCLISRILQKIYEEKATVIAVVPHWPTQVWWPQMIALLIRHPIILPNKKTTVYLPSNNDLIHPLYPRLHLPTSLPLVWRSLQNQGISAAASDIIVRAWRHGTIKQYKPYLCKWESYCRKREIDPLRATVVDGMNFLTELFYWQTFWQK